MAVASRLRNAGGEPMTHALQVMGLALLVFASSASLAGLNPPGESWRVSEAVAFAEAQVSGRHVVVVFAADWCLPCRKVEQIINDDQIFNLLSESFIPLHFDITELSEHDEEMQAKYRVPTLPAVIFVNAAGRELSRWNHGNFSAEAFVAELQRVVDSNPIRHP